MSGLKKEWMPQGWTNFDSPQSPEKGSLLLASPFMQDPNFRRAVVLLAEHDKKGSLGFILNKPLDIKLPDIAYEFPYFDARIYFGGPVQMDHLRFIHRIGNRLEGSVEIAPGIFWGGQVETLKSLIRAGAVSPADFRFILGYSGWDKDQLADEVEERSWAVSAADSFSVFDQDPDRLWSATMKTLGEPFRLMANFPIDPRLN